MSRLCPDDAATLEPRALHGLTLDACPVCAGVYFDDGEVAALVGSGPDALSQVERDVAPSDLAVVVDCGAPKRCPGCRALMCAYTYRYSSDARMDGCERCGGVWVMDGGLAKIAAHLRAPAPAAGGLPAARRPERRHAPRPHPPRPRPLPAIDAGRKSDRRAWARPATEGSPPPPRPLHPPPR